MKKAFFIILAIFMAMQFIQIDKKIEQTAKDLEIKAPENIMIMFKNACYDCHSNEVKWPWYSSIAPFSWIISDHVSNGRLALNFSQWERYTKKEKKKKLKEIFRTAYASMPLTSYIKFHKEADLTREERSKIRDWTGVRK